MPVFVKQLVDSKVEKGSKAQQQAIVTQFVSKLNGVVMSSDSFEIEKLIVSQNNLQGKGSIILRNKVVLLIHDIQYSNRFYTLGSSIFSILKAINFE